jgi:hypothetical protein
MESLKALRRTRAIPCLTAIVVGAALTWSATATRAAWDGVHDVNLGDQIGAQCVAGSTSDLHRYVFYAPKDTTITGSITAVKGRSNGLTTEWKLYTDMDVPVTAFDPLLVNGKLKTFKFAASGDYYFQVRGTAGDGFYNLKTAVKFPKAVNGATTTGAFTFDALAGTVMGVTVKPTKGSTATPNITGLTYLGGTVDLTGKSGKKATTLRTKLSKVTLPVSGTYTLAVDPITAGQSIDVKVTLAPPKTGVVWSFGAIGPTRGLAAQNRSKWLGSGHADYTALPFNDWNNTPDQKVPTSCARCHTTTGYRDYLGADGSTVGVVDVAAPVGQVVNCDACHNDKADNLTSVTFPSGLSVSELGNEARCMVCHQGRESTVSVEASINKAEVLVTIANDETAATGIVGVGTNIAAGATFTDAGAAFGANGITSGTAGVSYYYIEFVSLAANLNGANGVVTTKNVGRFKVTGVNGDTLTLERPLAAETVAAGKSFQYRALLVTTDDSPMAPVPSSGQVYGTLGFKNVHYFAAAASLYGREAAGGYEYADPVNGLTTTSGGTLDAFLPVVPKRAGYDIKFTHVASRDTCIQCHDPHSLEVRITECATCHVNKLGAAVASKDDLHDIRMAASAHDYNGDGDLAQGIWYEIKGPNGLEAKLLAAIQSYATTVVGSPISYDGATYPYFFNAGTSVAYDKWTGRLLRAAYNYQFSFKDPGSFAHNGKYIIELLYDSIADLNAKNAVTGFASLSRNDPGHFDSDEEAYRHWDAGGAVDSSCARCHSVGGFQFVVANKVDPAVERFDLISGFNCESCHVEGTNFGPTGINTNADKKPARVYVASVSFPFAVQPLATSGAASTVIPSTAAQINAVSIFNGAQGTAAEDNSYICMTCHRARESKLTIDAADPTGATTNFTLSFKNSHYLAAGATQYGSKAAVMYQYNGNTYAQRYDHDQAYNNPYPAATVTKGKCEFCHMGSGIAGIVGDHDFKFYESGPNGTLPAGCTFCHSTATTADQLTHATNPQAYNYDGDANTKPKQELAVFQGRLLTAIQNYCAAKKAALVTGATWVVYDGSTNPYWFVATQGPNETSRLPTETGSTKWDTKGSRAAFNYNFSIKEPGCWAHNPKYVLQVLYDSINDMDPTQLTGLTRPN